MQDKIDAIYFRLDEDGNGGVCVCVCVCVRARACVGLDFAEFQHGIKDMCDIHLTRDDFDIITENGKVRFLFFFVKFLCCSFLGFVYHLYFGH